MTATELMPAGAEFLADCCLNSQAAAGEASWLIEGLPLLAEDKTAEVLSTLGAVPALPPCHSSLLTLLWKVIV